MVLGPAGGLDVLFNLFMMFAAVYENFLDAVQGQVFEGIFDEGRVRKW